jgi:hypothetical protein
MISGIIGPGRSCNFTHNGNIGDVYDPFRCMTI